MKVSFQLTMPNVGSWNGKWSGAANKYYQIRPAFKGKTGYRVIDADKVIQLLDGKDGASFHYNFGDGWSANVRMEIVNAAEAKKREKQSAGFCGYEWMIDSILKHGKIIVEPKPQTV